MARGHLPHPSGLPARLAAPLRGSLSQLRGALIRLGRALIPRRGPPARPGRGGGSREGAATTSPNGMEAAPRYLLLFLGFFAGGMILISLLGDQGLIAYYRLRSEARYLKVGVERLQQRREEMERRIVALREDPGYIELLARRRLGLVKPGDVIIQPAGRERP